MQASRPVRDEKMPVFRAICPFRLSSGTFQRNGAKSAWLHSLSGGATHCPQSASFEMHFSAAQGCHQKWNIRVRLKGLRFDDSGQIIVVRKEELPESSDLRILFLYFFLIF